MPWSGGHGKRNLQHAVQCLVEQQSERDRSNIACRHRISFWKSVSYPGEFWPLQQRAYRVVCLGRGVIYPRMRSKPRRRGQTCRACIVSLDVHLHIMDDSMQSRSSLKQIFFTEPGTMHQRAIWQTLAILSLAEDSRGRFHASEFHGSVKWPEHFPEYLTRYGITNTARHAAV